MKPDSDNVGSSDLTAESYAKRMELQDAVAKDWAKCVFGPVEFERPADARDVEREMELPEPARVYFPAGTHSNPRTAEHWFTADQMHEYALAAMAIERERCAKHGPVGPDLPLVREASKSTAHVIIWRHLDGSGSGAVAAFTDKVMADRLFEILYSRDDGRVYKIETVRLEMSRAV